MNYSFDPPSKKYWAKAPAGQEEKSLADMTAREIAEICRSHSEICAKCEISFYGMPCTFATSGDPGEWEFSSGLEEIVRRLPIRSIRGRYPSAETVEFLEDGSAVVRDADANTLAVLYRLPRVSKRFTVSIDEAMGKKRTEK